MLYAFDFIHCSPRISLIKLFTRANVYIYVPFLNFVDYLHEYARDSMHYICLSMQRLKKINYNI
jgi:hypothetical protein